MSTSQVVQSSPFSSLTILESEVKVLTFDPNNYGHVEACRGIPPEQLATMQTRENAITRIPWSKFNEKIKSRELWKKWMSEPGEPGTSLGFIPYGFKAEVEEVNIREDSRARFLKREAPDLVDEYVAVLEWTRARNAEQYARDLEQQKNA